MQMTPDQCRMARAALRISAKELGALAEVREATVSHFEQGRESYASTIRRLQAALEARGVVFVAPGEASLSGGPGVRLREQG
jgi:transcriptional regulator with XRE-family HTH domain